MANVLNPDANKLSSGIAGVRRKQSGLVESAKAKLTADKDAELDDLKAKLAAGGAGPGAGPLTAADVAKIFDAKAADIVQQIQTLGAADMARQNELRELSEKVDNRFDQLRAADTARQNEIRELSEKIDKGLDQLTQTINRIAGSLEALQKLSSDRFTELNERVEQGSRHRNRGNS